MGPREGSRAHLESEGRTGDRWYWPQSCVLRFQFTSGCPRVRNIAWLMRLLMSSLNAVTYAVTPGTVENIRCGTVAKEMQGSLE